MLHYVQNDKLTMDDYRYTQITELEKKIEETKLLMEDPQMADLAAVEITQLEEEKRQLEESIAESNKTVEPSLDERNIIFEIKGAAGGDEASLWGQELMRMYMKYAQNKGFTVEQLDENVFKIIGHNAFGLFK